MESVQMTIFDWIRIKANLQGLPESSAWNSGRWENGKTFESTAEASDLAADQGSRGDECAAGVLVDGTNISEEPVSPGDQGKAAAGEEDQKITEKPWGTRKDYIDGLTAFGTAEYFVKNWKRGNLTTPMLGNISKLQKWLDEDVNSRGWTWLKA